MSDRLIIQCTAGACKLNVKSSLLLETVNNSRSSKIVITFSKNRFACWDSDASEYKNDAKALKEIKEFCEAANAKHEGSYKFLTPAEFSKLFEIEELDKLIDEKALKKLEPDAYAKFVETAREVGILGEGVKLPSTGLSVLQPKTVLGAMSTDKTAPKK